MFFQIIYQKMSKIRTIEGQYGLNLKNRLTYLVHYVFFTMNVKAIHVSNVSRFLITDRAYPNILFLLTKFSFVSLLNM